MNELVRKKNQRQRRLLSETDQVLRGSRDPTAEERDRAIASAVAAERVAILELVEAARKGAVKVNATNYAAGCFDTCDTLAAAIKARGKTSE
jgi:hypothetical protein